MLVIIDMQNDFVDSKNGKFYVKGSEKLVDGILDKISLYENNNQKIFYTVDCHKNMPDDNRSKDEKRWGEELYPRLKRQLQNHNMLKKDYYAISPEQASNLKNQLSDLDIKTIEIVGIETNVCILSNAVVLLNTFPDSEIVIDSSLCCSRNLSLHLQSINIMKELKMKIV